MLKKNKIIIIVIIIIIILCIILYNYYKNKDNFKNINEHFYDNSYIKTLPPEIYPTRPYFTGPGIASNVLANAIPAQYLVKGPNKEDVLALSDGTWLKTVVIRTTGNNLNATSFTADNSLTINNYKPSYINNNNTYVGNYLIIYRPEYSIYRTYMFGRFINNNTPIEVTKYADGPNGEKIAIVRDSDIRYVKMYVLESTSSGSPPGTARFYTDTTIDNYTPEKWITANDITYSESNPNGYQIYKIIEPYTGPLPTTTRSPSQPQPTANITANKIVLNNVNTPNIIIGGTNYGKILEISQLAVYSMINGVKTNVAPKGTATSSSVYTPPSTDQRVYSASNAIDGLLQIKNHLDDKPPFCSKTISSNTIGETWTLTLDKTYTIDSIVFYNRADCCQERANGVTVKFYNNSSLTVPVGTYTLNSDLIQKIQIAPPPPPTTTKPPRIMPTIPEYILPPVNPAVSPIIIPNIPIVTGYEYNNSSIKDALDSSYTDIQKERNTNLDNQSRIDSLDKRIKKLKMDVIGLNKSSSYNSDIKPPKFY